MIDFASITEAARDPLVIILGLFIFGGVATYTVADEVLPVPPLLEVT